MLNLIVAAVLASTSMHQDQAAALHAEAVALSNAGNHHDAVLRMEAALKLAPENHEYWGLTSHLQGLDGQYEKSVKSAKEAIRLCDTVGWYFVAAASSAHKLLDIPAALEFAAKAKTFGIEGIGKPNMDAVELILTDQSSGEADPAIEWKTTQKEMSALDREFGISILYVKGDKPHQFPAFTVMPANRTAIRLALPQIRKALSALPKNVVRSIGLRIVLASTISAKGNPTPGAADFGQRLIAINVDTSHHEPEIRHIVYHECLHVLDGFVSAIDLEADWLALNGPSFSYAGYEKPLPSTPPAGFATPYSVTAGQEDRADLFLMMMMEPGAVSGMADKDPVIAAKINLLKVYLASIHSDFNAEFWERAAKGAFRTGSAGAAAQHGLS